MGDGGFIIEFVRSCTAGTLATSECGPVWQLGVIFALLAVAITALVVLRVRAVVKARSGSA